MPLSEMQTLSEHIDKVLLEFLSVLDKYYQCQAMLEQNLKSGNLHMSRARYIRGVTSISSLKITEREMQASVKVECSNEGLETAFTLVSNVGEDGVETPVLDTLRKRNVAKNSDSDNDKQEQTSDDTKSNDKGLSKKQQKPMSKDPLNWFGVLVPQSLRYSQKNYKSAVEVSVELANLQLQIQKLQTQYQQLLQEKNVLALAEMKVT